MRLFLLAILILSTTQSYAQASSKELEKHKERVAKSRDKSKNLVSLDTLFASGKPYCIMIGSKKILGGYGAYSIRPLGNPENEVIYLELEVEGAGSTAIWFWNMIFVNQGQKIRFRNGTMDLENTIVDYNLLNETGINIPSMNKLVILKGDKPLTQPAPVQSNRLVERNRNGMIQIFGTSIQQSGVQIGIITKEIKAESGGVITHYTISLPSGEIIATAKNSGATDHVWQIVMAKDNSNNTISSSLGNDERDIVKYLVEQLYL
jgi:hypothetical protein